MLRKISLEDEHYYHVYNRGTEKRRIFMNKHDYLRFLISIREFNRIEPIGSLLELNEKREKELKSSRIKRVPISTGDWNSKLVEIICYNLLPNHYHFIFKQLQEKGVSKFMHKLNLGYTMYFNKKNKRTGALFQGKFKSAHIKSEAKLCWLSAYVNCNAEIHKMAKVENWIWSSHLDFIGKRKGNLCNKKMILSLFDSVSDYGKFSKYVIKEALEIKKDQKDLLE